MQVVKSGVVSCTTTNVGAATVECRGMKLNGLDVFLGPTEANMICNTVTGKGYNTANGLGVVPAPYFKVTAANWDLVPTGNASPMQNLTCNA
jgi:hypothetical protein